MKFAIISVALFAVVFAAPPPGEAEIIKSESDVGPESFKYAYETSDGSKAEAEGHLENPGAEDEAISVKGSFSYVGDDGQTYTINYIADKNGYQPQGAHLPTAPEP